MKVYTMDGQVHEYQGVRYLVCPTHGPKKGHKMRQVQP